MPGVFGGGSQQTPPATSSYGGNPAQYIPTAQPQSDTLLQSIMGQLYGTGVSGAGAVNSVTDGAGPYGFLYPLEQNTAVNVANNPYTQQAQGGLSNISGNLAPGLAAAGTDILAQGTDPQSALYNQQLNQLTQGANAANAASGVAGPYAANTTDQALSSFQTQWQNQQLQRSLQGVQGAGGAYNAAAGLEPGAANFYNQQQNAVLQALGQAGQFGQSAYQLPQITAGDLQSYLGLAQGSPGAAANLGALGFGQNQTQMGNLGSLLSTGLGGGSIGNALYGSGGLAGALGLDPSTGLLGGLLGGDGLSAGAAGAASGFGDAFGGAGAIGLGLLGL